MKCKRLCWSLLDIMVLINYVLYFVLIVGGVVKHYCNSIVELPYIDDVWHEYGEREFQELVCDWKLFILRSLLLALCIWATLIGFITCPPHALSRWLLYCIKLQWFFSTLVFMPESLNRIYPYFIFIQCNYKKIFQWIEWKVKLYQLKNIDEVYN